MPIRLQSWNFKCKLGSIYGDYSVEDIAEHRLVVRQAKDGDTVVEQYAYVQHFDADGNTLGSAGVDVLNSKFIQLYDRMQAVGGETPKETEITGAETAAIFASINNIMDALVNDGSVGTLSGLNNSTVITPLPSEESLVTATNTMLKRR